MCVCVRAGVCGGVRMARRHTRGLRNVKRATIQRLNFADTDEALGLGEGAVQVGHGTVTPRPHTEGAVAMRTSARRGDGEACHGVKIERRAEEMERRATE